ncbi:hypothetical protein [Rhodopirellula baltica]|uniref:Uncharacterized protein n=1 Tax=Rhodopirellula baltica SWK14 TaxID=993516 RepID=L7CCE0_RHOBT|nr:hypothetical protein [Rhodopirellula baltica]ELP31678.1 hypothetical protein RBSWK_04184 [Rhodopirellula baltica SWK14]
MTFAVADRSADSATVCTDDSVVTVGPVKQLIPVQLPVPIW